MFACRRPDAVRLACRQRLLAKLQQRLGNDGGGAASNEGSPTPPDSGSSSHSLSATSRHGVTVNIPEVPLACSAVVERVQGSLCTAVVDRVQGSVCKPSLKICLQGAFGFCVGFLLLRRQALALCCLRCRPKS